MQTVTFQTSAHAKCILAGEHTVLRGGPALVLPISQKVITLTYENFDNPIDATSNSPYAETFLILFWNAFHQSLNMLNKKTYDVQGKFHLENNIQMGAGLGFSAALCVVVSRWLIWEHWLNEKKLFPFAHRLEDMFHGKSSGADVAGALADNLVHYEASGDIHEVHSKWQPKFYLSYSGSTKITEGVINKVKLLRKSNPTLAKLVDKEMKDSVAMIEEALNKDENHGFKMLATAIDHARHCFEEWGLITPGLQEHIEQLLNLGAIAAKPTGAGAGGYVLSLWKDEPPQDSTIELLPIFKQHHADKN